MIMMSWSKWLLKSVMIVACTLSVVSCAPEIDTHLAECMNDCNEVVKECTTEWNVKMDVCPDYACQKECIVNIEKCFMDVLECTTVCVDKAEKNLKDQ